ncbi:MAG: hypothetical protein A3G33_06810 [Omnitrophica bacterium RIFCSPLOWO2_12_FULL_44_17]|uniref:Uncharacterized protein n=1 Tax=Candidatus Danuiimicrobium aquiferis TaxID=1801832 RepID=A0A1G1L2K5_9BACT|nr:MAG: hypothetical protein A3B72_03390 [Omnitrophica bacterium RIFCSPHIGHO2_02_FULL_45_28]OGW88372.1 MAG: hypothetical protein A3E74_09090 [Omnitrophica bacterium RIFCSPHIGHO2_12_FULL_44_12]OGW99392.1 MAG: hypothetical protein A3G33_06810 [Omnitrophica bacterium RIFCSPLOWO2_12_FULL_44_17]OGX03423.1 MAG: hypothetical protein A3J12_11625 [Omnitrophica bacterium RIFCSPLOWO2_02_FULL_44_11]
MDSRLKHAGMTISEQKATHIRFSSLRLTPPKYDCSINQTIASNAKFTRRVRRQPLSEPRKFWGA